MTLNPSVAMLSLQNIIFPTDFSPCAEGAFPYAVALAERTGATVHVLHVVVRQAYDADNPLAYLPLESDLEEGSSEEAGRRRQAQTQRLATGVSVTATEVEDSSAAAAILEFALQRDADLIVMGTHGRRGMSRFLLGSVAERIVRLSDSPVLTVAGDADPVRMPHVGRLLVPVDFSPRSRQAVREAALLAETFGAELELLHVIDESVLPTAYHADALMVDDWSGLHRRRSTAVLEQMARDLAPGIAVRCRVEVGDPAAVIVDAAAESQLVVIATHGLTGIRRLLMGSVTEKVVRLSPTPVFTLKSFGRALAQAAPAAQSA